MQNAETVLGVLRERGRKGLPCQLAPVIVANLGPGCAAPPGAGLSSYRLLSFLVLLAAGGQASVEGDLEGVQRSLSSVHPDKLTGHSQDFPA